MSIDDLRKCSQYDKLKLNKTLHWQFLDSWTFTDWKDTSSFPGKQCSAEGIVLSDDGQSYVAKLMIIQHNDMNRKMSLHLLMKKDMNSMMWDNIINIVSVEKEK